MKRNQQVLMYTTSAFGDLVHMVLREIDKCIGRDKQVITNKWFGIDEKWASALMLKGSTSASDRGDWRDDLEWSHMKRNQQVQWCWREISTSALTLKRDPTSALMLKGDTNKCTDAEGGINKCTDALRDVTMKN